MRLGIVLVMGLALTTSLLASDKESTKRLSEAAAVLSEVMAPGTRASRRTCWSTRTAS